MVRIKPKINHKKITDMKKILWMMVLAVGLMSCGASRLSPEERAARKAAIEENAKKAIADQNFRINDNNIL
jgi:hypothetical protein